MSLCRSRYSSKLDQSLCVESAWLRDRISDSEMKTYVMIVVATVLSTYTVAPIWVVVTAGAVLVHVCSGNGYLLEQYVWAGAYVFKADARTAAAPLAVQLGGGGHEAAARTVVARPIVDANSERKCMFVS